MQFVAKELLAAPADTRPLRWPCPLPPVPRLAARGFVDPAAQALVAAFSSLLVAASSSRPRGRDVHSRGINPSAARSRMSLACAGREGQEALKARMDRLEGLKAVATSGGAFSEVELDSAVSSMRNAAGDLQEALDWAALWSCLSSSAHEPYKDWGKTEEAARKLADAFLKPSSSGFRRVFQRVFRDGQWDIAAKAAAERGGDTKPWIVLVTGLNGIRKTTCMYQPWFKQVLYDALRVNGHNIPPKEELPDGSNSFFRQLDHIIATVANEEFRTLYVVNDVEKYASLKDGIFTRYRKIAEMWGILLVKQAQEERLNIMVETSGRDPGMFHYIDYCFPDDSYRKLVIHFEINDIGFAERSVDARMLGEMALGQSALVGNAEDIIRVNSGGPYGSKVLRSVQIDSNRVWEQEVRSGNLAKHWYKASISIAAQEDAEWTARATSAHAESLPFPIERL